VALCILALLLAACDASDPAADLTSPTHAIPTLFPTAAIVAPRPSPRPSTEAESPDTGWITGDNRIALRRLRVSAVAGKPTIPLVVVRLDLAEVQLRVAYAPERPRALRGWFDETQSLLAINGGFFDTQYRGTALVIADGEASGTSYEGFGGMLAVTPAGSVALRPLRDQPYDPTEPLAQAMQSSPMLVFPGGAPAVVEDDGRRARRTAVALDRAGHLLLIVSPTSDFTLSGFADWLSRSDLDVDRALNLDGGSSTGLFLKAGILNERIDSLGPLPLVLLVDRK
jgi:uncharacterized protein YigE (DUF2233 family)